ncbi:MAG: phenylalanine--tRNA ligase subunit beta [Proteobacteria bacterium]|nr:phenylalanine--tRNA ligase subunit beta [Pseudomonadota bacterium]
MKISRLFCQQFLTAAIPAAEELAALLTARGLEVEEITASAIAKGIVLGEIISCAPHPNADKLQLCMVNVGNDAAPVQFVCGAANARSGLRVAVAAAEVASINGKKMQARKIREVLSPGMICSAVELGIGEEQSGILELTSACGAIGDSLDESLLLNDDILEVNITPNRGDCLSHLGIAREVAAAIGCEIKRPQLPAVAVDENIGTVAVTIAESARAVCPYYGCCVIRATDCARPLPWRVKTLIERCGGRCVSTVVDITNYLTLVYGQPLHAFDLDKLQGGIQVRYATAGETFTVLDGSEVNCKTDTLLIADAKQPLALGGVMGGADSGITVETTNILLEAAHFIPTVVAGRTRDFKLSSEAAFRFERGVDDQLPPLALEQASAWVQQLCGGQVGPLSETGNAPAAAAPITLPATKISRVLGLEIAAATAVELLNSIQLNATLLPNTASADHAEHIQVAIPSWRFDLKIAEDIIEEIVRLHGYEQVPETLPVGANLLQRQAVQFNAASAARLFFSTHGFYEIISYAFVAPAWQQALSALSPQALANPMSEEMSVMRTTLWGGLLDKALFNVRRRQERICLFEIGRCFLPALSTAALPQQPRMVGGLIQGLQQPTQWDSTNRMVDFYDAKGVCEQFLAGYEVTFRATVAENQPGLHPGRAADIYIGEKQIGSIGELHPTNPFGQDFKTPPFLFEINLDTLTALAHLRDSRNNREDNRDGKRMTISRFPPLWRDLAFIADSTLPAGDLLTTAKKITADMAEIIEVQLFDFYQGDGVRVEVGKKSCGLRFLLQGQNITLASEEIEKIMAAIVNGIQQHHSVELRVAR